MAKLSFRQGIVRSQEPLFSSAGGMVSILATNEPVVITFAHGDSDYLITEPQSVSNAWGPFSAGVERWLYWEINQSTGLREFGYTEIEPTFDIVKPVGPVVGQMWFDMNTTTMKEYSGTTWKEVVRVFACKLDVGLAPFSMSINAPAFAGTQVGLEEPTFAGALAFDGNGQPIRKGNRKFFTTEDLFVTGVPFGSSIKINNIVMTGVAASTLADYSVAEYSDFNTLTPATPSLQGHKLLGLVEYGVVLGEVVNFITEGLIFNDDWNWVTAGLSVNDPVYISNSGQIRATPILVDQLPVGIVTGPQEILFAPRLFPQVTVGGSGGGAIAFTGLTDTPSSYAGSAGKTVKVNALGNALEFGVGGGLFNDDVNLNIIGGTNAGINLPPTGAEDNFLAGHYVGEQMTSGILNVAVGNYALSLGTDGGESNTAIGVSVFEHLNGGIGNTGLGEFAMGNLQIGDNNVAIGRSTASNVTTGSNNIFIGTRSGPFGAGTYNNQLFIHNTPSDTPLIHGDFSSEDVTINGDFTVTGDIIADTDLDVTGDLGVDTDLVVRGNATVNTDTIINGDIYVDRKNGSQHNVFFQNLQGVSTFTEERLWYNSALDQFQLNDDAIIHSGGGQTINGSITITGDVNITGALNGGSIIASPDFCPGYTYSSPLGGNQFIIADQHATSLFAVGRRVKMVDDGVDKFGIVSSVTDIGTLPGTISTEVNLAMESGATLGINTITDACLTSSTTSWVPIGNSAFTLGINYMETGLVGATQYNVAVGEGGQVAYSIDGGVSWAAGVSGTTNRLLKIVYDPQNQNFVAVGDNTTYIVSSDGGATWTPMSTISTLPGNVKTIAYYPFIAGNVIVPNTGSVQYTPSTNTGATAWTTGGSADISVRDNFAIDLNFGYIYTQYTDGTNLNVQYVSSTIGSDVIQPQGVAFTAGNLIHNTLQRQSQWFLSMGTNGHMFRSVSSAPHTGWTPVTDSSFGSDTIRAAAYSPLLDRIVAVGHFGKIAYSNDQGVTWTQTPNGFGLGNVQTIVWDPINNVFIAADSTGKVCRSTNGIN